MTKRERVEKALAFEPVDKLPFVPAVYEHKARLVGRSPSEVCRSADLLLEALERELAVYDPDVLTVGLDVYNVEAEAAGCEVRYFGREPDVPAVAGPVLAGPDGIGRLRRPDPAADGRMPLFVDVAARLARERGRDLVVRGAVTGPFSLACALTGTEELLVATVEDPGFVRQILAFASAVSVDFGRAFLERGVEPVLFDSKASPGAASPRVFRDFVRPAYRDLVFPALRAAGARMLPLIIGGDTTPILEDLLATGAGQLLCDAGADLDLFARRCAEEKRAFRASVDARLVHTARPGRVREEARGVLGRLVGRTGVLFGCGVVAYDCDPRNVLALREARDEFARS
ncbi:MAG TPA: uroporphyrinogen decarboxylase family protein [Candidatus Aminicenantes bacterium]|nr:uroporphyrinogen decarboxylase family protein [Candidatus Aminicenantes bacterium]HRY65780.1 uroporphyrinogen decarboxylase family protein [Candidatus Aminicenantes bacterium]HRZ72694.1 uroporphyrinogen decarboxylase family protein [Candidatus Aminicenantes bacterium]